MLRRNTFVAWAAGSASTQCPGYLRPKEAPCSVSRRRARHPAERRAPPAMRRIYAVLPSLRRISYSRRGPEASCWIPRRGKGDFGAGSTPCRPSGPRIDRRNSSSVVGAGRLAIVSTAGIWRAGGSVRPAVSAILGSDRGGSGWKSLRGCGAISSGRPPHRQKWSCWRATPPRHVSVPTRCGIDRGEARA